MKLPVTHIGNWWALLFIGALLFFIPMLPSAIAAPPGPGEINLSAQDNGRQTELGEGQILAITLEANPSTGYKWEVAEPDETILRQIETRFEQPSDRLGAPGKQILRFGAVKAGQAALKLVYRRPWEKEAQPTKTFSLGVRSLGGTSLVNIPTPTPVVKLPKLPTPLGNLPALSLPATYDWCNLSGCTPIKNQASCGSCWAFGTVGPLEANIKIWDGQTRDLAEQYLVSCASEYSGCDGGWFAHDYHQWEIPTGELAAGAVYEGDFPYQALDSSQGVGCNFTPQPHTHHEKVATWAWVGGDSSVPSVAAIKQAIYEHGPVAAAICVGSAFQGYSSGVFSTSDQCYDAQGGPAPVNHAIVLVGWDDNQQTWRLRNSWGTGWGESGYMNIKWGTSNVGYAANYVVYGVPGNLSVTPVSQGQINLTWADNSGGESGFKIERSPDGTSNWTQIATVAASVTTYADPNLACNTTYYYRVRAYTASADSSYSNVASAKTSTCGSVPTAPTGLNAVAVSQTRTDLSWTDNSGNESGFRIERSPDGTNNWMQIDTVGANVASYSNTGLTCNTLYYYRVRAFNAGGDSDNSNTAHATTSACTDCLDAYEPDNAYVNARPITVNGGAQAHNFHAAGDEDWAKFTAVAGRVYTITTSDLGANDDTYLYLYNTDGVGVLASDDDDGSQPLSSKVVWAAAGSGTYYVKVRHYDGSSGGCTGYNYNLAVSDASDSKIYLPLIVRSAGGFAPNDPYYGLYQWGLPKINAPAAWGQSTGAGVVVAIVDTGVDLNHPDLAGKIVPGWDFANGDSIPQDDQGHGTHVAGIAAAMTNNSLGVAGLGWDARIMPVKVLDSYGNGYYSDVADGIRWAVDHGARVINLSLGGEGWSQTLQDATDYAFSHGALVVAAAGNCGDPVYYSCLDYNPVIYPAANPNVLAVGATTSSDTRASFSEYGYFVDVTAPGENIYSTLWNDTYEYLSGTSMASPLVTGLASLVWARRPTLSNAQVADAIQSTAVDLGTPGRDDEYGYGRINAAAAVSAASSLGISSSSVPESVPPVKAHAPANAPLRPGVVLVRWKPGALAADRQSVLARHSLRVAGQIEAIGVQKLIVPAGRESETAAQLAADPAVEFAEPDYQVHLIR